jgi:predicted SprT family Zn-dependent metalloprotease
MTLEEARALALQLMDHFALFTTKLEFNRRKRTMGCYHVQRDTIYLSSAFIAVLDEDEIRDTILHEIAHALHFRDGNRGPSHGREWQRWAILVGARPVAKSDVGKTPPSKYVLECCGCGYQQPRHRRPKYTNYSHRRCRLAGKESRMLLKEVQNGDAEKADRADD